jgi:hypothetical protein
LATGEAPKDNPNVERNVFGWDAKILYHIILPVERLGHNTVWIILGEYIQDMARPKSMLPALQSDITLNYGSAGVLREQIHIELLTKNQKLADHLRRELGLLPHLRYSRRKGSAQRINRKQIFTAMAVWIRLFDR